MILPQKTRGTLYYQLEEVKTKIFRHTLESIQYEPAHLILSLAIEFIGSSFSLSV